MVHSRPLLPWFAVILAAVTIMGCGERKPATYPVTGTVVYPDGKPLANARVQFRTVGDSPTILGKGKTDDQGRFVLTTFQEGDGAVEGEHLVAVAPYVPDDFDGMTAAERNRAMFPIDPRFRSHQTSGIRVVVSSDPAQNDFRIEVRRPRR